MNIDYPYEKFVKVREEIFTKWHLIDSDYTFFTPIDSNIIGYDLFKFNDTNFPNTIELLNYIKKNKYVFSIIMYVYKPYSRTHFHSDPSGFRYVYPIISNEMCFNYELISNKSYENLDDMFFKINTNDSLLKFNNNFIEQGNKISNWEEGKIYLIGPNIHSHLNFSDNLRIALVIDNKENLI